MRVKSEIAYNAESQWKMVKGLADASAISIESASKPGYFLRHKDGKVWLEANDNTTQFKNDATWHLRTGLANSWAVSFESYNISGAYLRHRDGLLEISSISTDLDRQDATFYVK
ncbi:hypothetical protein AWM70_12365 [Paenibacillus yonginensis]|uniref:Alpha-L-arabinofuranosidase B arabinose-binding domain-containing protein n=1 Tax=Paenibacillus yonginensis TaxID=1462996 RepID=A0A1B1N1J1_9BACL|nr:AbfB domain-containing protein [Paenibacillus yonginensis]ANS75302.1 hypothetical protein AWM70_12365 [Paenibacillus yonginensis]